MEVKEQREKEVAVGAGCTYLGGGGGGNKSDRQAPPQRQLMKIHAECVQAAADNRHQGRERESEEQVHRQSLAASLQHCTTTRQSAENDKCRQKERRKDGETGLRLGLPLIVDGWLG